MGKTDSNSTKSQTGAPRKPKSKISLIEKFNQRRGLYEYKFLNLEKMQKKKPYRLTHLENFKTIYGIRVLAELDCEWKLMLPERYNDTFSAREMRTIKRQNLYLINYGPVGKTFDLKVMDMDEAKKIEAQLEKCAGSEDSSKIKNDCNSVSLTVNLNINGEAE